MNPPKTQNVPTARHRALHPIPNPQSPIPNPQSPIPNPPPNAMIPKPSTPKASPNGMPYWLPRHPEGKALPPGIRRAVVAVLRPLYKDLVLNAPDELERSTGLTIVHLAWLEVCDQIAMAGQATDPNSILAVVDDFRQRVNRHLELVDTKCRATELLMRDPRRLPTGPLHPVPISPAPRPRPSRSPWPTT